MEGGWRYVREGGRRVEVRKRGWKEGGGIYERGWKEGVEGGWRYVCSVQLRTGSEIVFLIRLKLCACYISPSMFGNTG